MTLAAAIIGLIICLEGILGLASPSAFARLIAALQVPPLIYLAALARIAFGLVLLRAARLTRFPRFMRTFGALIAIGGAVTPFAGARFAHVVLDWWTQSASVARVFAAAALVLGGLTLYATLGNRRVV